MLRRSAEHVMINMVIAIFERLKNLEDEWQFVDTPNDLTTEDQQSTTADPHMSTPKPSPSPTLQQEQEKETVAAVLDEQSQEQRVSTVDNSNEKEKEMSATAEEAVLTESPKAAEEEQEEILPSSIDPTTDITAGKTENCKEEL